ncbi:MAG: TerB family tellurite resistance protein [Planctomycetes bacterium]|nr:TerB family tellurite resistance protein [Planctomycetota bacterium]
MSRSVDALETPAGTLRVVVATQAWVDAFARTWPLPVLTLLPREDAHDPSNARAAFYLPFAHEGTQVSMAYFPEVPLPLEQAEGRAACHRSLSARIVAAHAAHGFRGLAIPLCTLKRWGDLGVPGVGLVAGPSQSADTVEPLPVTLDALRAAIGAGHPFQPATPPKFVPATVAGELQLDFGLFEGHLVCFHPTLEPGNPDFTLLARAGFKGFVHLPLAGTEFPALGPGLPPSQPSSLEPSSELSANGVRRIYRLMAHMAACDGEYDPREQKVLAAFRETFPLSDDEARALELEGQRGEKLSVGKNPVERELLFELLLDVAAADGVLDRAEKKRLVAFAKRAGVSPAELQRRLEQRFGARTAAPGAPKPLREESDPGARRIYRLLCYLASSDGGATAEEQALLESFRVGMGIDQAEAAALRDEGLRGENLQVGTEEPERALLLDQLLALAVADGEVTTQELRRLRRFCKLLKVPPATLERRLRQTLGESRPAPSATGVELPIPDPAEVAAGAAHLVLLDLPAGVLALDFFQTPVPAGFLGFRDLEPGVHRVSLLLEGGESTSWVRLDPGAVEVLSFAGGVLHPADEARRAEHAAAAGPGGVAAPLAPGPRNFAWSELTEPLLGVAFPPPLLPIPRPTPPSRLEHALLDEHDGQSGALLAELAYAFLRGSLDDDAAARERWTYLVQAFYTCGDLLPTRVPNLFCWGVRLLMAQMRQVPPSLLGPSSALTFGSHCLSDELLDTEAPELVEAGLQWATFIAGYHAGAPEAPGLPRALSDPEPLPPSHPFAIGLADNARDLEAVERLRGRHDPELIPLLSYRSTFQEFAGDLLGALVTQERLVALGERCRTAPELLAKGYGRLARLCREAGRREEALAAERRGRELALGAAQLN